MILRRQSRVNITMLILAIVVTVVSFSLFIIVRLNDGKTVAPIFKDSVTSFEAGWQNQYGLAHDLSRLSTRALEFDTENALKLTKQIPESDGDSLVFFRTHNLVVNAYVDDELVYFTGNSGDFNGLHSFDSYCSFSLNENWAGKNLTLEMYKTKMSVGYCIDNFYFGTPSDVMYKLFASDAGIIFFGVASIIIGVVFLGLGLLTVNVFERNKGLVYFGFFAVSIGMWFLTDSIWFYNLVSNISVVEKCSYIFLLAALPCLLMYVFEFFKIYHRRTYLSFVFTGFTLFIILVLLDSLNILTFSYSVYISHLYIGLIGLLLLVEMISYLSKINGNKGESKIFNIGVIFFIVFSLYDLGRYYQGNQGDSSQGTRLGTFILVVTAASAVSGEIVSLLKLGIQAGKIGKIAFTDANTGLGNPAAFKSRFEELDRTKNNYSYIAIIQFDVNNLKIINDTKGHEAGDLLIKTAAEIIDTAFSPIGNCYRVGGDEFVAITTYNHAPSVCEEAIYKFENLIEQFNNNPNKPFDLRIAYGVAYYQNNTQQYQSLKEVHKLADERMYNNKKELKARYAKTPEEAIIR